MLQALNLTSELPLARSKKPQSSIHLTRHGGDGRDPFAVSLVFQEHYCRNQPDGENMHFPSLLIFFFFISCICPISPSGKWNKPLTAAPKHFSLPLDVPSRSSMTPNTELYLQNSNVEEAHFLNETTQRDNSSSHLPLYIFNTLNFNTISICCSI